MPERHPLTDRQQPVRLRPSRGRGPDPEPLGRLPKQQRIAERFGRREQQQPPSVTRQRGDSTNEALLDPPRETLRAKEPEPTRQLRRRQPSTAAQATRADYRASPR